MVISMLDACILGLRKLSNGCGVRVKGFMSTIVLQSADREQDIKSTLKWRLRAFCWIMYLRLLGCRAEACRVCSGILGESQV